jgi:hypothetical protein
MILPIPFRRLKAPLVEAMSPSRKKVARSMSHQAAACDGKDSRLSGKIQDFDCGENEVAEYRYSYAGNVIPTMKGSVANILQRFAGIAAAFAKLSDIFSRPPPPASEAATGSRGETAAERTEAVAPATETVAGTPPPTSAVAADAKIGRDGRVTDVTSVSTDQQEVERRRELIRVLFNDFWNGRDDKPAAFADRLDQAEIYINERLTASGEFWQVDAKTRKMLGLPAQSNSRN